MYGLAGLEYRIDNLIYNFIKVLLLDGTKATCDIALYVTRDYLTLHQAGFGECEAIYHIIAQWVGILRI